MSIYKKFLSIRKEHRVIVLISLLAIFLLIAMGINRYVYNNFILIKDPSPPVNYYSVQYGIGFTYPENWKVIESTENTEPLKDCQIYIDGGNPWACFSFFDRSNPDLVYEQVINYIKIKPNALIEDETTIDQDLKWTRIEYSYDGRTNYSNFLRQHNCVAYFSNQDQKSIFIDFCSDTGVEKKARTVFENIINSVYIETP